MPYHKPLSRRGLTQLSQHTTHVSRMTRPIVTSTFNRLGQYTSSPCHSAYCYAELAVSSLALAKTIASTYCVYPRRDSQAEQTWVTWLNTEMVYLRTVTHPNTNRARRRATTLIETNALPLSQTAPEVKCITSEAHRYGSYSFYTATHHTCLHLVSVHRSLLAICSSHLITAYYSFTDPERMKGRVGLIS